MATSSPSSANTVRPAARFALKIAPSKRVSHSSAAMETGTSRKTAMMAISIPEMAVPDARLSTAGDVRQRSANSSAWMSGSTHNSNLFTVVAATGFA